MDGSRIVMKLGREVSTRGSTFCIRRFREDPFSPCDIVAFRTMTSLMVLTSGLHSRMKSQCCSSAVLLLEDHDTERDVSVHSLADEDCQY